MKKNFATFLSVRMLVYTLLAVALYGLTEGLSFLFSLSANQKTGLLILLSMPFTALFIYVLLRLDKCE